LTARRSPRCATARSGSSPRWNTGTRRRSAGTSASAARAARRCRPWAYPCASSSAISAATTPAGLRDYTDLFHPALIGLTGTRAGTAAAARAFRVYRRRVTEGRDADAYLLDHSSFTYLLGPDGRTRQVFPATITAEAMAAEIARQIRPALAERRLP
jgi:hypothetical protein